MPTTSKALVAESRLRHAAHRVAFALDMLSDYVDLDDEDMSGYCHMLSEILRGAVEEYETSRADDGQ